MSVADKIIELLNNDGWVEFRYSGIVGFHKKIKSYDISGQFSTGDRIVHINLDSTYRWFSKTDGWGKVDKDLDLRLYSGDDVESEAQAAIADLLNRDKMVGRRS